MSNRLTKITTRTGDDGSTGLGNGQRVRKNTARMVVIGDVDELNSTLGVLLAETLPQAVRDVLLQIQHDLFDLGGELAVPGRSAIGDGHVARLDRTITETNAALPPLQEFILPGGSRAAALAHVSRTVCRRAERALITLADAEKGRVAAGTTVTSMPRTMLEMPDGFDTRGEGDNGEEGDDRRDGDDGEEGDADVDDMIDLTDIGDLTDIHEMTNLNDTGERNAAPSTTGVSNASRLYLNRLSDLLFVLAREINRNEGVADVYWRTERSEAPS